MLHGLGYRYRLHRADLPGQPDLVFPSRHKIVFVNGCFWHRHTDCDQVRIPATNRDYWLTKLERNRARDARNIALLEETGWTVMTVWECQLRDISATTERLLAFLERTVAAPVSATPDNALRRWYCETCATAWYPSPRPGKITGSPSGTTLQPWATAFHRMKPRNCGLRRPYFQMMWRNFNEMARNT